MSGKGGGGGVGWRAWTLVDAEPTPRIGALPQGLCWVHFGEEQEGLLLPIRCLWHYGTTYGAHRNDVPETCQTASIRTSATV